jgi:glycosyltransferase involved in cell wall biosynthesis
MFPSSYDIWGLVVNEAMAAGLCVLASNKAAATQDLITNNTTGFSVNYDSSDEVLTVLQTLFNNTLLLSTIRNNAQAFITTHITIDKAAQVFATL